MFRDLKQKYGGWVLDVLKYDSPENLLQVLEEAVVRPALKRSKTSPQESQGDRRSPCKGLYGTAEEDEGQAGRHCRKEETRRVSSGFVTSPRTTNSHRKRTR
jgi:hypothetical protein